MALKKTNTAAFEQETTVADDHAAEQAVETSTPVAETPAEVEAPRSEAHQDAAAKTTAAVAIANATNTSLSVADAAAKAKEFQREINAMRGASDFSYGNFRVFKGNNGEIAESGGEEATLGRWAKVRLLSWDDHFEISPGEQGASTKDFVAYSKDGKRIDSVIGEELKAWVGKSVDEYVEYLRTTEEFANTKCRRFVDMAVALMAADHEDAPIGEVIQVTLSESSIPAFSRYQEQLSNKARCVAMGLPGFTLPEDPFTFFLIREVAKKGDNKWTKLKVESNLPAKI